MPEAAKIRILIADDHRMFRQGLRRLLETEPQFEVVGEAVDGEQAVASTQALRPDILLLDITMPRLSGLDVLRQVGKQAGTHTLLLTAAVDRKELLFALDLGARGAVLKDLGAEVLAKAIRCVMAGEYWVDRESLTQWAQEARQGGSTQFGLTPRELTVIAEITAGGTNRDIAVKLGITEDTVKRHLTNVYDKLGVSNRLELALFAMSKRLVISS
jgi:two-component system nitrate/nitrite response regulator NarL